MKENSEADFKSATEQTAEKKLFIETYGCQMNVADSEVVASIMQMDGYALCDSIEDADAILVNTCSIRDNAEQKVLSRLQYFNSLRKKKESGNRNTRLHGRTGKGRIIGETSCRFSCRPRCLS